MQPRAACFKIYLTHIASQLLYRYLLIDLPMEGGSDLSSCRWHEQAITMNEDDWRFEALEWGHWYGKEARDSAKTMFWDQSSFLEALVVAAQRHLHQSYQQGTKILLRGEKHYPSLLNCISDPPWAITYWGDSELFSKDAVALVGARKASSHALEQSYAFGHAAADNGLTVVSGGAFGCDIAGHRGVLLSSASPCPAIVVLASGLSNLYPRANEPWFREIRRRGGILMSERLWWAACRPNDFLVRNRLISGLAKATCIMQAARRSGAMTTARFALDQGRDVYVLEGDKDDIRMEGNRGLSDDGATTFSRSVCLFSEGLLH